MVESLWLQGHDLFKTLKLQFGHEVFAQKEFDPALMPLACL